MSEFDWIARYFAPLSGETAWGLTDDAAFLPPLAVEESWVIAKDTMVAGVHFLGTEGWDLIARKLLRVNLSDMAAMGATPYGYLLSTAWPEGITETDIAAFTHGLQEDQQAFGITLLGGDTVRSPGPAILTATLLGHVPTHQMIRRHGAKAGDALAVSGTLGDGALGLRVLRAVASSQFSVASNRAAYEQLAFSTGNWQLTTDNFLPQRYLLPSPRIALGIGLRGIASSMMDVSDGLSSDLAHLCKASGVGAVVEATRLPRSPHTHAIPDAEWLEAALHGGDDYELLFTYPPDQEEAVQQAGATSHTPVTQIGRISEGSAILMQDREGKPTPLCPGGFRHF